MNNRYYTVAILAGLLSLTGCSVIKWTEVPEETGHYYITTKSNLATVGKVVIFELDDHSNEPELAPAVTDNITEALQKRHLFSISSLHKTEPDWLVLGLDDVSSYKLEDLANIRKQLKADAALFGSITQYYPYPHMLMGLHLRLVDLRDGRLLWALEQVWDSTDKRVELRMRHYFEQQMRTGYQPMDWKFLITSPRAFKKFVVSEVAETFPASRRYGRKYLSSENNRDFSRNRTIFEKTLQIPQKTLKFAEQVSKIKL